MINTPTTKASKRSTKANQKFVILENPLLVESKQDFNTKTIPVHSVGSSSNPARSPLKEFSSHRVTAYATAYSYDLKYLYFYLSRRPWETLKIFDDCIYARPLPSANPNEISKEYFFMNYGVVVLWGFENEDSELKFLRILREFENESLGDLNDVEVEELRVSYDKSSRPKICNDVIVLQTEDDYMTKLAISFAIAQSSKLGHLEHQIEQTLERIQQIPNQLYSDGTIIATREDYLKAQGELFELRTRVLLGSSVLAQPDTIWSSPEYVPLYDVTRTYLEIEQRVEIMNQKTSVISDMLQLLNSLINNSKMNYLVWAVIILFFIAVVTEAIVTGVKVYKYYIPIESNMIRMINNTQ